MASSTEPALRLAQRLLGGTIQKGPVRLRIVEVEAYGDRRDSASHARFGRTERTWPMFEGEGRLYVYLCYGIHWLVNLTAGSKGRAGAVLVRGAEVVSGADIVWKRRGMDPERPGTLAGPGKVGQALGVTGRDSGMVPPDGEWRVQLRGAEEGRGAEVHCGPRIGVDFAAEVDRARPWRLWLDSRQVSKAKR